MKIFQIMTVLLAFEILILGAPALAEQIIGTITAVDSSANTLTITRLRPPGSEAAAYEELKVLVPETAQLKGVKSLEDLKNGAQVKVEAVQNGSGVLEAQTIETDGFASEPSSQSVIPLPRNG